MPRMLNYYKKVTNLSHLHNSLDCVDVGQQFISLMIALDCVDVGQHNSPHLALDCLDVGHLSNLIISRNLKLILDHGKSRFCS